MWVCVGWDRAGVVMQPRYNAATVQPQSVGYQYFTPVYSQYPSVAVPPPPASWLQPAAAAASPTVTPGGIANHYVMPQQLQQIQPTVCSDVFTTEVRVILQFSDAFGRATAMAFGL